MKLTKLISHKTTFRALCVAGTLLVGCEGGGGGDGDGENKDVVLPANAPTATRCSNGLAFNSTSDPLGGCNGTYYYKSGTYTVQNRKIVPNEGVQPIGYCCKTNHR